MNGYLHSKGIQYKQGDRIWILYQKYAEQGLTSTKTHAYLTGDGSKLAQAIPVNFNRHKGTLYRCFLREPDAVMPA